MGVDRVSDFRKADMLVMRDIAMMATASRYDLSMVDDRLRSVRDLDRLFFHLAKIMQPDLFIEAGAKDAGVARRAVRQLNPRRVVAFEANPHTFARFAPANAAVSDVEYLHLALTDQPGTVTFNVRRDEHGKPRADGQSSLLRRESDEATGFVEVKVPATTLDTFFAGHAYERGALWIDVEGASHVVLSGGRETLEKAAVVMIEVEDRHYFGGEGWLRAQVLDFLYDRGLVPVARDFQSRYLYNIVLVRAELLDTIDRVRWALTLYCSAAPSEPAAVPVATPTPAVAPAQTSRPTAATRSGAKSTAASKRWRRVAVAILPPVVAQALRKRRPGRTTE